MFALNRATPFGQSPVTTLAQYHRFAGGFFLCRQSERALTLN